MPKAACTPGRPARTPILINSRKALLFAADHPSILFLMTLGVLKEAHPETRVSLVPEIAAALQKAGVTVRVESGAGAQAFHDDAAYAAAGATIVSRAEVLSEAQVVLAIHPFEEVGSLPNGAVLIGVYNPLQEPHRAASFAEKGLTVFSLDMLPRTTRAQSMDVLSSQANIAGYKAVLLAAASYSRYFPMFMTAAGSIPPAKVLIIGAGVAGLQ